jgi:hypothetical protein
MILLRSMLKALSPLFKRYRIRFVSISALFCLIKILISGKLLGFWKILFVAEINVGQINS